MKIELDPTGQVALFTPNTALDERRMSRFPGLLKKGSGWYAPSKTPILRNLVDRLKALPMSLTWGPGTYEAYKAPWTTKPLPEDFYYHTKPLVHQDFALKVFLTYKTIGLLLDPGLGKTKVVLDGIFAMKLTKVLIICPNALTYVWKEEVEKHRPELTIQLATTTDFDDLDLTKDILVMNYEKAVIMGARIRDHRWGGVVVDEGLIKNPYSERSMLCHDLASRTGVRVILSGTLINNTPMDLYSPVKFLCPALVGTSFSKFRDQYAITREVKKANEGGADFRMVVGYKNVPEMRSILEACSIVMTKEEWLKDLPPKIFEDVIVPMTGDQQAYYESLAKNKTVTLNECVITIDNPLVEACKLIQISSGFMYLEDSSSSMEDFLSSLFADDSFIYKKERKAKAPRAKRETYFFQDNQKPAALRKLLQSMPNEKVIVWFNLTAEAEMIEKELRAWGITYTAIKGGEKSIGGKVSAFNQDTTQVLLAQARVINYGVTVMGSNPERLDEMTLEERFPDMNPVVAVEIFYSLGFSLEIYLQQQDRIHRIGQVRPCRYYRLVTDSPIEHKIVKALDSKTDVRLEMLVDVKKRGRRKKAEEDDLVVEGLD